MDADAPRSGIRLIETFDDLLPCLLGGAFLVMLIGDLLCACVMFFSR